MDKQAEQARELLVKQRQEEDLRQDAMRTRSEEELHHAEISTVDAQAREAMAQERAKAEETQEKILERSLESDL
jgi:hypothetical protein